MKQPTFKYYVTNWLILLLLVSAGWIYFDYQQYSKYLNWQKRIESGELKPIEVKLTTILTHKEKGSLSSSDSLGARTSTATTVNHVGHLVDSNGAIYKQSISYSKLSSIKVNNIYKLYKIGGAHIVPEFNERVPEEYSISSAGWGLGIILLGFTIYLGIIYLAFKFKKPNLHQLDKYE